jgi:hypothetical protein
MSEASIELYLTSQNVTRQEKEVKEQIELYRLDSWRFDAKIKFLKQQLKSMTKETRTNSKSGPKKRLVKTDSGVLPFNENCGCRL